MLQKRKLYPAIERRRTDVPLDQVITDGHLDLYPDIVSKGYFSFTLQGNKITLFAGNYVGLIPLNSRVAIHIEPKIGKENWIYIVGKAQGHLRELLHLRTYLKGGLASKPLLEFLSRAFLIQLASIEQHGLYRRYQSKQEITCFPRGRILIGDSIKQVWARSHRGSLAVEYYTFSKDIPHNRLLKYALDISIKHLDSFSSSYGSLPVSIADLEDLFKSIPLDQSLAYIHEVLTSIKDKAIPEVRAYYEDACMTAILLVEFSGLSTTPFGNESTLSFVVNMETVFEDYCFNVLREYTAIFNWKEVGKGKSDDHRLFSGPDCDTRNAEPDIFVRDHTGRELLLEVKYKGEPNRQDINQAVTYALAYNNDKVVLLCFAEDTNKQGWQFLGNVGTQIAVWIYHINLDSENIKAEEECFVSDINQMLSGAVAH